MIMYAVLMGRNPVSYYKQYREWYMKTHNHDCQEVNLPFIPPSESNFCYDPFAVNFDNPFDKMDIDDIVHRQLNKGKHVGMEEAFSFD